MFGSKSHMISDLMEPVGDQGKIIEIDPLHLNLRRL